MTEVFVIRNQLGHYWGKSKAWIDGSQSRLVLRTRHRDEAVNTLVELSSKNFELRGDVVATELSERGEPVIEPSNIPLPMDPAAGIIEETVDVINKGSPGANEDSPQSSAQNTKPAA